MKNLEKKIEEAGSLYSHMEYGDPRDWQSIETTEIKLDSDIRKSFVSGAKSDEAKQYWRNGMFDEDDMKFFATRFRHHCDLNGIRTNNDTCNEFDTWFKQNKNK